VLPPYEKHLIGKQLIKTVEGVNIWFRTGLEKAGEKNSMLLQKFILHYSIITTAIYYSNRSSSYI
jgi:hypothetical protein